MRDCCSRHARPSWIAEFQFRFIQELVGPEDRRRFKCRTPSNGFRICLEIVQVDSEEQLRREEVELDLEPMVINTSVAPAFILNRDIFPDLFVDWWSASAAWYED
jgi:hypothetical protein